MIVRKFIHCWSDEFLGTLIPLESKKRPEFPSYFEIKESILIIFVSDGSNQRSGICLACGGPHDIINVEPSKVCKAKLPYFVIPSANRKRNIPIYMAIVHTSTHEHPSFKLIQ